MLTLQCVIVILVGWSAIYWGWTETRFAVILGGILAYLVTVLIVTLRDLMGAR